MNRLIDLCENEQVFIYSGDGDDDLDAEFDVSDGSVSLDDDGSDLFESEDQMFGNDSNSDADVSDPEDKDGPPKSKRFKPVNGKQFQKKLKNTNSKFHFSLVDKQTVLIPKLPVFVKQNTKFVMPGKSMKFTLAWLIVR